MKTSIAAAILGAPLMLASLSGPNPAAAAPPDAAMQTAEAATATDLSAQRRIHRHSHEAYHRYYPYYYERPYDYRPYPYVMPAPFIFGFGFGSGMGPWW